MDKELKCTHISSLRDQLKCFPLKSMERGKDEGGGAVEKSSGKTDN